MLIFRTTHKKRATPKALSVFGACPFIGCQNVKQVAKCIL